jgi:hypothetical protein
MKTRILALLAPLPLVCFVVPSAAAQTASPATRRSSQFNVAWYDLGYATVSVTGYGFGGDSPNATATYSMIDDASRTTLAFCQSTSASVSVTPSGHSEVKFSPQVDILCPTDAPIVLTCEPGLDTLIFYSTHNTIYRGTGATPVAHNDGWNMYGLRCSILAAGVEYQTTGSANLYRYLIN